MMTMTLRLEQVQNRPRRKPVRTFDLFWSPEGRCIGTVQATTEHAAIRKAPFPYSRYKGEIYAVEVN
jgi:hypothetical protein